MAEVKEFKEVVNGEEVNITVTDVETTPVEVEQLPAEVKEGFMKKAWNGIKSVPGKVKEKMDKHPKATGAIGGAILGGAAVLGTLAFLAGSSSNDEDDYDEEDEDYIEGEYEEVEEEDNDETMSE